MRDRGYESSRSGLSWNSQSVLRDCRKDQGLILELVDGQFGQIDFCVHFPNWHHGGCLGRDILAGGFELQHHYRRHNNDQSEQDWYEDAPHRKLPFALEVVGGRTLPLGSTGL
jgi:hypothetical protein